MNIERLDGLLWELIDGEISHEDHVTLREYLVGRPEAEERRREFSELATQLNAMKPLDPPRELRKRINAELASVPVREKVPAATIKMPPPTAATWPMRASYLAAGLLLGVGLTFLIVAGSDQDLDQSKLYGSVQHEVPLGSAEPVDLEDDAGTLSVERQGTQRLVDLDLGRQGPILMEIESQSGLIRLESLDQNGGSGLEVSTKGARLLLSMSGPTALRLVADVGDSQASLLVTITAEDAGAGSVRLFAGEISNVQ